MFRRSASQLLISTASNAVTLSVSFTGRGRVPFLTHLSIVGSETPSNSGMRKRRMYPVVGIADDAGLCAVISLVTSLIAHEVT